MPILTLTSATASLPEQFPHLSRDNNGPFSLVLETGYHQHNKASPTTAELACVVKTKPKSSHPIHKLDNVIAGWLDEHQWIATRTRNAAAHLNRRWRDLSQEHKHMRAFEYAEAAGARAFSLNLSEMVEKRATAAPDPARYLAKRLNGKLKAQGLSGLKYAFILDVAKTGKLHVHGFFVLGENDIMLVESALRQAGGKASKRTIARQLSVSDLHAGLGFRRYSRKARKKTAKTLAGGRFEFVNQNLNRAAEGFHEENRPKKRREQRDTTASTAANSPLEAIGESLAHLSPTSADLLGCAPKALLWPRQELSHAIAFSDRSSGRGGQSP